MKPEKKTDEKKAEMNEKLFKEKKNNDKDSDKEWVSDIGTESSTDSYNSYERIEGDDSHMVWKSNIKIPID